MNNACTGAGGDDREEIGDALVVDDRDCESRNVRVDNVTGSTVGDGSRFANGTPLRSYRVADFSDLADAMAHDDPTVLDVRQQGGHGRPRHRSIPLHQLALRTGEVAAGEVWVHCGSGYGASIAASMLDPK